MRIKNKFIMNKLSKKFNKMSGEKFNIQINEIEINKKKDGRFNTCINADIDINPIDLILK